MAAAAGILVAYRAFAPAGFVPFAIALAGGFLVAYTVELLRFSKAHNVLALRGHGR
jgi:hypothetical protein